MPNGFERLHPESPRCRRVSDGTGSSVRLCRTAVGPQNPERLNPPRGLFRDETMTNPDGETAPCCKVGAVTEAYGLDSLDATLRERWTAATNRSSVRGLADYLNREILGAALRGSREGTLEGEVENYYRLLSDDDVSLGVRTEAQGRLRERGVDVERIEDDFVSHQTVYRHLTDCLGIDRDDRPADDETVVRDGIGTIRALQRRIEAVTRSTVDRLTRDDHVHVGDVDVLVDVTVTCRGCGEQLPLSESLAGYACECVE